MHARLSSEQLRNGGRRIAVPGQPGKTLLSQDKKTTSGGEKVAGPGTEHPEMSTHSASILTGTKLLCSALGG